MPNRLTHLHIQNFRSLANVSVETRAINVLFGPNGSGKSTLLDAIWFVRDCLVRDVAEAASKRSQGVSMLWVTYNLTNFRRKKSMTTVDLRTEAKQILNGLSEANLPVAVSLLTALNKQEAPKRTELLAVYPWARSLSDEERDEFFSDLSQATTHARQSGDGSIVEEVISAWKETAEIVADPEMMADIEKAEADIEKGKVVPWDKVKRKLHIG